MNNCKTNPINIREQRIQHAEKISNIISNIGFVSEEEKEFSLSKYIFCLLNAVENSDPKMKSQIENNIVSIGEKAVSALVDALETYNGMTRGLVAMALIRIGKASVTPLIKFASKSPEKSWMTEYIINEINGSQVSLSAVAQTGKKEFATV